MIGRRTVLTGLLAAKPDSVSLPFALTPPARAANVHLLASRFDAAYAPLAKELQPPAWALALF